MAATACDSTGDTSRDLIVGDDDDDDDDDRTEVDGGGFVDAAGVDTMRAGIGPRPLIGRGWGCCRRRRTVNARLASRTDV